MKNLIIGEAGMRLAVLSGLREVPEPPGEMLILPEGEIEMEGFGKALLDEDSAAQIIARFERRGIDMVIDYEHQTDAGVQAPAAGWIKKLTYKAQSGLYATVEWTEKAKDYLKNREYRYFSPVILLSEKTRKILFILSMALTNLPRINNLKPIMAKLSAWPNFEEKEEAMEKLLLKLKQILGLAAETTEEKVGEAIEGLVNKVKDLEGRGAVACREVMEALGAKPEAGKEEVIQIVASLKAPAGAAAQLGQEVVALRQEISAMKTDGMLAIALKEGKTSPEEISKWGRDLATKDPEQFKLIVLSRPVGSVVPIARIGQGPEGAGAESDFDRLVEVAMKEKKLSRGKAIAVAAKENPKEHQAWLSAQEKAQGF